MLGIRTVMRTYRRAGGNVARRLGVPMIDFGKSCAAGSGDGDSVIASIRPGPDCCDPASNFHPPDGVGALGRRLDQQELIFETGFRRMEADGQAPHAQHRVQAPSRSRVLGGDPALACQAPRHLPQSDPGLGAKVRSRDFDEDAVASDLLQQFEARIARWKGLSANRRLSLSF
jgi:hypothetical protein